MSKSNFPELYIKFNNFVHKEKLAIILYADFECLFESIDDSPYSFRKTSRYQKNTTYSARYYSK